MKRFFIKSSQERWCPSCGKRCNDQANFCENCGAKLRTEGAAVPQESTDSGEGTIRIWRLIAHHERGQEIVGWSRRERVIAIGWGGTGDLRECHFRNEKELTRLVADGHPGSSVSNYVHGGRSLWRLYTEMRQGDLVILSTGGLRELTMRVTGDYYFVGNEFPPYYEHRRKAEALPIDPNRLWRISGGAAPGENIRRTLIRCAHTLTEVEFNALIA